MITLTKIDNSNKTIIEINREKLDVLNMKALKENMTKIVADGNINLLINLKQVTFIDSSGLSVLISLFKQLKTLEGSLELSGLNEQPSELLEITQLDKIFTISEECN
ncbi:MAG: Unknown protein [uncultured Sulfurovum sp.]|uniref:Anti-sigma factor antagonist n=1 Tax=uncultured Sulfurovum sp. TaxID=269237 RepID=A0A6S6SG75_9BACT|nr:MAG: Unknown protein [uncultured Sulfurovum sp.]